MWRTQPWYPQKTRNTNPSPGLTRSGKTLGGSTSINGMTQTRAQAAQYDALSSLLDPDSDPEGHWTWTGMFSAMLKSEGFSAPNDQQRAAGASSNPAFHNTTGPLQVTYPDAMYHGDQQKWFKQVASGNFSVPGSADADGGEAAVVAFHPNVSLSCGGQASSG